MIDVLCLLVINLVFIMLVVRVMRNKIQQEFADKYGANIDEFKAIIESIQDFDLDSLPQPKSEVRNIYNDFLVLGAFFLNANKEMNDNNIRIVKLSEKNKELVTSCVKIFNLLSHYEKEKGKNTSDIDAINKSINKLIDSH